MRITILYFQMLRAQTGTAEELLELPESATVGDAIQAALASHAALAPLRASILAAVNEHWAPPATVLRDGDVLALMPPVSGG